MDNLKPEQRKRCMSQIRNKNTRPELIVRSLIHHMGYRYRLHRKDLPGTPDIVLPKYKKIIEIRGCFWHMHACRYGRVVPKTNTAYWEKKRTLTVNRDKKNAEALLEKGWDCLILWECEIKREYDQVKKQIIAFLDESSL